MAQTTQSSTKKRKYRLVPNETIVSIHTSTSEPVVIEVEKSLPDDRKELLKLVEISNIDQNDLFDWFVSRLQLKSSLSPPNYTLFIKALTEYQKDCNLDTLVTAFAEVFSHNSFHYLFRGMRRFVKENHKENYDAIVETLIWNIYFCVYETFN